jgi:hypothetical protein
MLNPHCETMMVAPTMPMFWRFMQPNWEKVCPPQLRLHHSEKKKYYQLIGGRRVWYGSAEDPKSLEGDNLAALWGDEVRYWRRDSWRNFARRLRDKKAQALLGIATSTPAPGWMEEYFPDDNGIPGRELFRISTRENAKHLDPGYIEQLEQTYSPELIRSIIDGEYDVLEGQVYKTYSADRHLIGWRVDPQLKTYVFMDFGMRRSSVLLAQETGETWPTPLPDGRVLPPEQLHRLRRAAARRAADREGDSAHPRALDRAGHQERGRSPLRPGRQCTGHRVRHAQRPSAEGRVRERGEVHDEPEADVHPERDRHRAREAGAQAGRADALLRQAPLATRKTRTQGE